MNNLDELEYINNIKQEIYKEYLDITKDFISKKLEYFQLLASIGLALSSIFYIKTQNFNNIFQDIALTGFLFIVIFVTSYIRETIDSNVRNIFKIFKNSIDISDKIIAEEILKDPKKISELINEGEKIVSKYSIKEDVFEPVGNLLNLILYISLFCLVTSLFLEFDARGLIFIIILSTTLTYTPWTSKIVYILYRIKKTTIISRK